MDTKSLLIGIISFIAGGLLVSVAASTFEKPVDTSMQGMVEQLKGKTGDEFDKAFLSEMIMHHQGAIDMAKMANDQAKHDEVKKLSAAILSAQDSEINDMKQWQVQWGYSQVSDMKNM
jgi:uncharacterized protein (DUF305 family)